MRVSALNNYIAMVPVRDFHQYDVILAMHANGQEMRIRDHGPLFIIYPFDDVPALTHELYEVTMSRSIWQVNRIDIN